jgi:LDH2 family malate/lactate/ureidoglycolate dehydrogenase
VADTVLVDACLLRDFARKVLAAAGADDDAAELCAEVFVDADLAGNDPHGVARLNQYVEALASGRVCGDARPEVIAESGAVSTVDAHNALGPVGLRFATDLAVRAAGQHGVAVVAVHGSNHAGSMSWYIDRAAGAGMFAMIFTGSTKAMVAPLNGVGPFLGTNAMAYAAPAGGTTLAFDASMSVAPRSKLEAFHREGVRLPEGWAVGPDGRPAVDAGEVIDGIDRLAGHSLLPFGGVDGGHKGFGISLMVELLCGPIAGADWGPRAHGEGPAGVGHFVLCMDRGAFGAPHAEVEKRIEALCTEMRAVPSAHGAGEPVRLPGDRRTESVRRRARDGIPVPETVLRALDQVAALTNVTPLARQNPHTADTAVTGDPDGH